MAGPAKASGWNPEKNFGVQGIEENKHSLAHQNSCTPDPFCETVRRRALWVVECKGEPPCRRQPLGSHAGEGGDVRAPKTMVSIIIYTK